MLTMWLCILATKKFSGGEFDSINYLGPDEYICAVTQKKYHVVFHLSSGRDVAIECQS